MKATFYIVTPTIQDDGGMNDSPEAVAEILHSLLDEFISAVLETNSEEDCEIRFASGPSAF